MQRPVIVIAFMSGMAVSWSLGTPCRGQERSDLTREYLHDAWTIEDGLPQGTVTAIAQGPDGYLWIGTFEGLVRFDGVRMTVFDRISMPELPSSAVINVHVDATGRLWVSTDQGLIFREGDRWRSLDQSDGWVGNYVRSFSERDDGDLLFVTFDRRVMEYADGVLHALPDPPAVGVGCVDDRGDWWIVADEFVGRWTGREWEDVLPRDTLGLVGIGCGEALNGGVWVILGGNLLRYQGGVETLRLVIPGALGTIWQVTEDSDGYVWLATEDRGLWRVSPSGAMRQWGEGDGLGSDGVRCVFEDHEKNLWIGTSGGGLHRLKARRFRQIEGDLARVQATSLSPDGAGGLWVATWGQGVLHWREDVLQHVPLPPEGNQLDFVEAILTDRRGRTWIGTHGRGLCLLENSHFRQVPTHLTGRDIHSLFEDSQGRVWIGGSDQLSVFEDTEVRPVLSKEGLSIEDIRWFAEDASGKLWLASRSAVYRQRGDLFGDLFEELLEHGRHIQGTTCLATDTAGSLWLGSEDRRLLRYRDGKLEPVHFEVSTPVRDIRALMEDDDGYLWLLCRTGVAHVKRSDLSPDDDAPVWPREFRVFDAADGLTGIEIASGRQPVAGLDDRGRFWIATLGGVFVTEPDRLALNSRLPPVRIERVTYMAPASGAPDEPARATDLTGDAPPPVILPPGTTQVEFVYTAISLTAPGKNRFQIRFGDEDARWHDMESRRTVRYHGLGPGPQRFSVRASNNDGRWNPEAASVAIVILPYFWQTAWFRAGALASLLALGGGVGGMALRRWKQTVRDRLELQQKQNELLHVSRVAMLGRLSASLSHELNQPLTAILSNAHAAQRFLSESTPDLEELREILSDIIEDDGRAAETIRRLRTLFRKADRSIEWIDLSSLLASVVSIVHSDAIMRNVEVFVDVEEGLPAVRGDQIQLQQVMLNLLLNAFEALEANPPQRGHVRVQIARDGEASLVIRVRDDGPGLADDQLAQVFEPFFTTKPDGMGMGLSICRSIVETHGGTMRLENDPTRGAIASVRLPVAETAEGAGAEEHGRS